MKQVFRKGLSHIVVADAPEPMVTPNHVLVNPVYSLISSGTESASIHEGIIKEVAENPSQLRKVWEGVKAMGPISTIAEVRAKFQEYAALGYAGAGVITLAFGTSTPTSMTVVATRICVSLAANRVITSSFSAVFRRPCSRPTRKPTKTFCDKCS